jgi:putative aldouronate transport system substrate-binding protein
MSKTVRYFSLFIVLAVIMTQTACKKSSSGTTDTTAPADTSTSTGRGQEDPFAEHLEISYMGPGVNDKTITDANKFVQLKLEEKFNITLTFSSLYYYNNPTEFNLLVAAGALPKMGFTCLTINATEMNFKGHIRDILKTDVERLMPNYVAFTSDRPLMLAWQTKNETAYYGLYQISSIGMNGTFCTSLRLDWMEKLDIAPLGNVTRLIPDGEVQTDTPTDQDKDVDTRIFITDTQYEWDEFVSLLESFVNDDPDGNGLVDTYGLSTNILQFMDGYYSFHIFPIEGMNFRWVKEADGRAAPQLQSVVYNEFLAMHRQLANEGLMIPEYWVAEYPDVWQYWASGQAGAIGQVLGYIAGRADCPPMSVLYNDPDAKALMIPPTAGKHGHDASFMGGSDIGYLFINSDATDAEYERILALWDWMFFSEEGRMTCDYGVEGVNYFIDPNDSTRIIYNTEEQNDALPVEQRVIPNGYMTMQYFYKTGSWDLSTAAGLALQYEKDHWPSFEGYYVFYGPGSADALSTCKFSSRDNADALETAYREYVIAVCEGTMDADTAYDQWINVCNGLGYQEYLKAVNDSMYIVSELQKGILVHPSDLD